MKDKIQGFIGVVLILIIYPFYSIYLFIKLVYQLICNLFTPKCKYKIDDIVGISYYSDQIMEIYYFLIYNDDNYFTNVSNSDKTKLDDKEYEKVLKKVKTEELLKQKKYIVEFPFISFKDYLSSFIETDTGTCSQYITFWFKDGKTKTINGFSKHIDNFVNSLNIDIKDIYYEE